MTCPLGMVNPTPSQCGKLCLKQCEGGKSFRLDDLPPKHGRPKANGKGKKSKRGESLYSNHTVIKTPVLASVIENEVKQATVALLSPDELEIYRNC